MKGILDIKKVRKIPVNEFLEKNEYKILWKSSGIYFLFNEKKKLIYIGVAKELRSRLIGHIKCGNIKKGIFYNKVTNVPPSEIKFIAFIKTDDFFIEQKLIEFYQPKYNIQYNPNPQFYFCFECNHIYPIKKHHCCYCGKLFSEAKVYRHPCKAYDRFQKIVVKGAKKKKVSTWFYMNTEQWKKNQSF